MSMQITPHPADPAVSNECLILIHLDSYTQCLQAQGFNCRSIKIQVQLVTKFSHWLKSINVPAVQLTNCHCQTFITTVLSRSQRKDYANAIKRMVEHLTSVGHDLVYETQSDSQVRSPFTETVGSYSDHLRRVSGLSEQSIVKYRPFVEQFLTVCFEDSQLQLSKLTAGDVLDFFRNEISALSSSRRRSAATALRSFLRFLFFSDQINVDLSRAVPAMANWSLCDVPQAISSESAKKILQHCPRDSAIGRRDYAILLLLSRLGLRSSEIVFLTLDCVDWDRGSLHFRAKGGVVTALPIPADVGEALADYVANGRPPCNSRRLFLCGLAPLRGLGSQTTVATIVHAAIKRAGVQTLQCGTHQFRHALAINLLKGNATLKEIGSILGHRHAKTTRIYAKVDYTSLRPLCLPWPGECK